MTLPIERSRAVQATERFLKRLALDEPRIPRKVRDEANRLLRHYPTEFDMHRSAEGLPEVWGLDKP